MPINTLKQFMRMESAGGIILLIATAIALIINNTPLSATYESMRHPLLFWINEGLMTFFFMLVGLELKRGFLEEKLNREQVTLSGVAALGGMLIPAAIYVLCNWHSPHDLSGWAIPVATDIAFALSVLSLFNKHITPQLKLFLMSLAIFDDLAAIILIALFYSKHMMWLPLLIAFFILLSLYLLNRYKIDWLPLYLLLGLALWFCLLKSGIHPTLAGVLFALMIPLKNGLLQRTERFLHPWVAFFIMPLFAFMNAGIRFTHIPLNILGDSITLGILLGLFLGKQLGVFGTAWLLIKCGFSKLPKQSTWLQLYGVAALCGIGFTMSLFLGTLAFQEANLIKVRVGVVAGSILSALLGIIILRIASSKKRHH